VNAPPLRRRRPCRAWRGGIALAADSKSLLADPTPLDQWLGVAAHA